MSQESTSYNLTIAHITRTADVAGGKPCIAGRRIRVQDIYGWYDYQGMTVDAIASQYDLTLAQVHAALSYAYEHLAEIWADIQQSETLIEEVRQQYPSKLTDKLQHG